MFAPNNPGFFPVQPRLDNGFASLFHKAPRSATLIRMSMNDLLSSVDSEITLLKQVRSLLSSDGSGAPRAPRKHVMSAAARKRIGDAQRKRWAAQKKASKKAA
jgi:hypothetical protein